MPETYIVGNEDGQVLIQCENEGCMREDDKGRWWYQEPVSVYHPTPDQIKAEWAAHIFTHFSRDLRD